MEITRIRLTDLEQNRGQVEGLPSNPRQWGKGELDDLVKSIRETPELLEARGLIVWPYDGKYIILGGNMRFSALREMNAVDAPCMILPEDTPMEKLREIVIKDNGAFGSWDYDMLANEWDDLPLSDWGLPSWIGEHDDGLLESLGGLSVESVAKAGESETGLSSITFVFSIEDAEIVKGWIDENTKEMLTNKIVEICQPVEAK